MISSARAVIVVAGNSRRVIPLSVVANQITVDITIRNVSKGSIIDPMVMTGLFCVSRLGFFSLFLVLFLKISKFLV
jgi:hypothetical protein